MARQKQADKNLALLDYRNTTQQEQGYSHAQRLISGPTKDIHPPPPLRFCNKGFRTLLLQRLIQTRRTELGILSVYTCASAINEVA